MRSNPIHTRKVASSIPAGTTRSECYCVLVHNICTISASIEGIFTAPHGQRQGFVGASDWCAVAVHCPNINSSV